MTALRFDLGPIFADHPPDAPGGMPEGRSIVALPFDGWELGKEITRLRPPLKEITFLGMMIGSGKELLHFFNVTRSAVSMWYVAKTVAKFARDMVFHGCSMRLLNGNALVGRLAKSCFDRQVPIWTSSPMRGLITDEKGRVTGARVETPSGPVKVLAAKGVVMAAGGFPQDALRRKAQRSHDPSGPNMSRSRRPAISATGGARVKAGGAVGDTSLLHSAAWVPISRPVKPDGTLGTFPHFVDRSKPGVIAITRSGKRFVNEANSYHDFCQAMVRRCAEEGGENAAWFIADHRTFRKYGLGYAKPAPVPFKHLIRTGYLIRGCILVDLANQIGADGAQLERGVAAFNLHARKGDGPEFNEGSTACNRSLGDLDHKPNPCVARVKLGPFSAVRL